MKIIACADLHGYLPKDIPECDLLILAGDICPHFDKKAGTPKDITGQAAWLDTIVRGWLGKQPAKAIVTIWGNHDFVGLRSDLVPKLPWILLEDSVVRFQRFMIYGTPWTPTFFDWAFMNDEEDLVKRFAQIPEGMDILVSHGPPRYCCDRLDSGERTGSKALFDRLRTMEKPPKAVVCGHIHVGRGYGFINRDDGGVPVWNVASLDERYMPHKQMWTEIEI